MDNMRKTTLEMHTLLLCADVQFLGTTRGVLNQLHVTPQIVGACDAAVAAIQTQEFDVIVLDWREIDNLADLLDLHQAFAAGVHFLIHKPASVVQIERCLRAAYCATVVRRRKLHREPVSIVASVSTRTQPFAEATIVNLSEGGLGLRTSDDDRIGAPLGVTEEVDLRFVLPGTDEMLQISGTVVWSTSIQCGIKFGYVPEPERLALESWLTVCVERSLALLCSRVRAVCA